MQLPVNVSTFGVFRLIDGELHRVEELIDKQLVESSGSVSQLLGCVNIHGGKMLRPGLVLLAGRAMGKITDEHIRVAAIVEIIHNATLLHDDVIDEGQRRRGAPTVNSLSGNETAVLLGDFLLSRAFRMCVDLEPHVTKVIAATAGRTCEGELRQVSQRRNWRLSESEYIDIITEKSAALFSSACLLGGLLAGGSETQVRLLSEFGLNVGIAFQITDDLLDIVGDEGKVGKTLGSDVDKNKLTLAMIHFLRTVGEKEKEEVINRGCDRDCLADKMRRYGSLEYARRRAQGFAAKAIELLGGLRGSEAKEALIETARFVGGRAI